MRSRRVWAPLAAASAVTLFLAGCANPTGSDRPGDDGEWRNVGRVDDLRARRIVYLPEIETFVLALPGEEPFALAAEASNGERLLLCGTSGWFFLPGGEEQFDIHGNQLDGPIGAGMAARTVRVADGVLEVDASSAVDRLTTSPDPEPSGPMCDEGTDGFEEIEPGFAAPARDLLGAERFPFEVTEGIGPGDLVGSPGFIGADVGFDASEIVVRLLGPDGSILHEETTACDSGTCPGYLYSDLIFTVDAAQPGWVLLGTPGPDEGMLWFHHIPVTLAPQPGVEPGSFVGTWYDEDGNPTYFKDEQGWHLTLHVINGAEHCGWQSASYLTLGWPPGTDYQGGNEGAARIYLRDPEGVFTGEFDVSPPDLHATLPADAATTGYHRGPWELWSSPTDVAEAVYLVADDGTVERWPRADQVTYCA